MPVVSEFCLRQVVTPLNVFGSKADDACSHIKGSHSYDPSDRRSVIFSAEKIFMNSQT